MKNQRLGNETILGGVFGTVAIGATILEMQANGFNSLSIIGGVKDIAGTMVGVMVFLIAVTSLIPKVEKLSFEEKLTVALSEWRQSNSTLIERSLDDERTNKYGFSMRTDIRDFYRAKPVTKNMGWFVRLPQISKSNYQSSEFTIVFHLNKGTFFQDVVKSEVELKQAYARLGDMFSGFINLRYVGFAVASSKSDEIIVKIKPLENDQDIKTLINLLNSMFQAYLASANIRVE